MHCKVKWHVWKCTYNGDQGCSHEVYEVPVETLQGGVRVTKFVEKYECGWMESGLHEEQHAFDGEIMEYSFDGVECYIRINNRRKLKLHDSDRQDSHCPCGEDQITYLEIDGKTILDYMSEVVTE